MSVAAVVLAAGASTRLGQPKQLIEMEGERLLERAVRLCREADLAPIVVVLGAHAETIESACELGDVRTVHCARWSEGMGFSVACGIAALDQEESEAVVVMTCDMPLVSSAHLRTLSSEPSVLTASAYEGRKAVPACFPRSMFPALSALEGDKGARDLLRDARTVSLEGWSLDIDTPEDLAQLKESSRESN